MTNANKGITLWHRPPFFSNRAQPQQRLCYSRLAMRRTPRRRTVQMSPLSPASRQLLLRLRQRQAWRSAVLLSGLLAFVLATSLLSCGAFKRNAMAQLRRLATGTPSSALSSVVVATEDLLKQESLLFSTGVETDMSKRTQGHNNNNQTATTLIAANTSTVAGRRLRKSFH